MDIRNTIHIILTNTYHEYLVKKYNVQKYIRENMREYRMKLKRLFYKMPDNDISIFCNNCTAGCVCHDMSLRFNSPTVNLIIEPTDYIEFLSKLKYYTSEDIINFPQAKDKYNCPVGIIDNKIKVYFIHYHSFEEAKIKWKTRCQRINFDRCYFILSERDGCKLSDLERFDKIEGCVKKISFVHKHYSTIRNQCVIGPDKNNPGEAVVMTDWIGIFGKRVYDKFNWSKWLK